MNIQPSSQNNVSMHGNPMGKSPGKWSFLRKLAQKMMDKLPEKTFNDDKKIVERLNKYDNFMSKPAENRLIMGVTALATQPAIDYYNHRVDDDTRTVSRNRSIAKIIAGTFVGCIVRSLCYKAIDNTTLLKAKRKISRIMLPKEYIKEFKVNSNSMKNYKSALATFVALAAMSVTNVVLDAPLTYYLTNKFNDMTKQNAGKKGLKEGIYG